MSRFILSPKESIPDSNLYNFKLFFFGVFFLQASYCHLNLNFLFLSMKVLCAETKSFKNYPYSKTCLKGILKKDQKLVFKTYYRLMQVKREHSAILSTSIQLQFVVKTFLLSSFEWLF